MLWNRLDAPLPEPGRIILFDDGMHGDGGAIDGFFAGQLAPGLPAGAEVQFYVEAMNLSGDVVVLPDSAELVAPGQPPTAWSFSLSPPPTLEISEVCSNNQTRLRDELGGHADYVKVRNTGNAPVNLTGVLLARSFLSDAVFSFPRDTVLAPGEEATVFADDRVDQGGLHAAFTLDAGGDSLALMATTASGARLWIQSLDVPAMPADSVYRVLPGTQLRAVIENDAGEGSWMGTAWDENGRGFAVVQFTATPGWTWLVEGAPAGTPDEWVRLRSVPGDGRVHTVSLPLTELEAVRAVAIPAAPALRVDAVIAGSTTASVLGVAARASEITVLWREVVAAGEPAAWKSHSLETGGSFEILIEELAPGRVYEYRVQAKNQTGEAWSGENRTFATAAEGHPLIGGIRLTRLNPEEVEIEVDVMNGSVGNYGVSIHFGTTDSFASPAAWQPSLRASSPGQAHLWTARLTGLARETTYHVRAAVEYGGTTTMGWPRQTVLTPSTRENIALNLRLSEIMYHPSDDLTTTEAAAGFEEADFEFIELQNTSTESMDLSGLWFDGGLDFSFPLTGGPIIPAVGFAVIASHPHAFALRYGAHIPLAGWTLHPFRSARLANSGEIISLRDADGVAVIFLDYDDWPYMTDGRGHSIEYQPRVTGVATESADDYVASRFAGGSPGRPPDAEPDWHYRDWKATHFDAVQSANERISGQNRDPDRDSLTHLQEYQFGTSPLVADAAEVLSLEPLGHDSLQLSFPVNARAKDAHFVLESLRADQTQWQTLFRISYNTQFNHWHVEPAPIILPGYWDNPRAEPTDDPHRHTIRLIWYPDNNPDRHDRLFRLRSFHH